MNLIIIFPFLFAMLKKYLIEKAVGAVVKTVVKAATLDRRNWSDDGEDRKNYAIKHNQYWWGNRSWKRLKTCNPEIQRLMVEAIKTINLTVLCGERNETAQEKALKSGASGVNYPDSIHNPDNPKNKDGKGVRAIDVAPYPVDWNDLERFCYVAGQIIYIARKLKIPLRWGADWNRDGHMRDDKERKALRDYPHLEYRQGEAVL